MNMDKQPAFKVKASDDPDYLRGRTSLGVIPRSAPFKLVTTPVGIDRGYAVQYWAQIEWK